MKITPNPQIIDYPNLLDAIKNGELVLFLGAGVSRLMGGKSWEEVARNLSSFCHTENLINYKEKESLLARHDPKKIITICRELFKEKNKEVFFWKKLAILLDPETQSDDDTNIYRSIIDFKAIIVTTNADKSLIREMKSGNESVVSNVSEFSKDLISQDKIYHIHGYIDDENSLVFTVSQYLERYNEQTFIDFLDQIFTSKTVLFIGYGLEEFELLDYLILKSGSNKRKRTHYILSGYFLNEENLLEIDQKYYNQLGITIIPFALDEKGYAQQTEILKNWLNQINSELPISIELFDRIHSITSKWDEKSATEFLKTIRYNTQSEILLFQIISDLPNPEIWFTHLFLRYYSDYERIQDNGIPWHRIIYLKNISIQLFNRIDEDKSLQIWLKIKELIEYQITQNILIENSYEIVSILNNIPCKDSASLILDYLNLIISNKKGLSLINVDETFKKFLNEGTNENIKKLLHLVLTPNKTDNEYPKFCSHFADQRIFDEYLLKTLLIDNVKEIYTKCGILIIYDVIDNLRYIIHNDPNYFKYYTKLDIDEIIGSACNDEYYGVLTNFIINLLQFAEITEFNQFSLCMFREKNRFFHKFPFYIINKKYSQYKDIFWSYSYNPLKSEILEPEVFNIIENNSSQFLPNEIEELVKWINEIVIEWPGISEIDRLLFTNKQKFIWIDLLKGLKNETADKFLISIKEQLPDGFVPKREKNEFHVSCIEYTPNESEINQLLSVPNNHLRKFLTELNSKREIQSTKIMSVDSILSLAVKKNPVKFLIQPQYIDQLDISYCYSILFGINEALREDIIVDWDKILELIKVILNRENFWKNYNKSEKYNYLDVPRQISFIIDAGISKKSIKEENFLKCQKYLLDINDNINSKLDVLTNIHSMILNTVKGSSLWTLFHFINYHASTSPDKKISPEIKRFIERECNNKPSIELFYVFGSFFPFINNNDPEWIKSHEKLLSFSDNNKYWEAFIIGIIQRNRLTKSLYQYLKDSGHYLKSISHRFTDSQDMNKIVQHICVGYFEEFELLENSESLINHLLRNNDTHQYTTMINFIWNNREYYQEKLELVKQLWATIMKYTQTPEKSLNKNDIFCSLYKWIEIFPQIDSDMIHWLQQYAQIPCRQYRFNFLKSLILHVNLNPIEIGEIYLIYLQSNNLPYLNDKESVELVEEIFKNGGTNIGCKICNFLISKGFLSYQDLHKKYCRSNYGI